MLPESDKSSAGRKIVDVRRSLRSGLRYGGVLMDLKYKRRRIQKPNVILLTDISGSMLKYSGFLLEMMMGLSAVLPNIRSVGVMGDERTYESCVALRAVTSTDGMTADWVHLPYEFLANVSNDIINKVKGVNRVVYDISSKPPATIEWE